MANLTALHVQPSPQVSALPRRFLLLLVLLHSHCCYVARAEQHDERMVWTAMNFHSTARCLTHVLCRTSRMTVRSAATFCHRSHKATTMRPSRRPRHRRSESLLSRPGPPSFRPLAGSGSPPRDWRRCRVQARPCVQCVPHVPNRTNDSSQSASSPHRVRFPGHHERLNRRDDQNGTMLRCRRSERRPSTQEAAAAS